MLKWTNSAQKPSEVQKKSGTMEREATPHINKRISKRQLCQLNKENIVNIENITSTPFGVRINNSREVKNPSSTIKVKKRDSISFSKFASTLPRFEEEYSPSTILPSGQELASRGLLPDVFISNQRYFKSPLLESTELKSPGDQQQNSKRKIKFDITEESLQFFESSRKLACNNSTQMTDQSLDKLIDAILESACKTQKRKKSRRSFNLRRHTLLRTHEYDSKDLSLSPSYAAGEDPASDLNLLLVEPKQSHGTPNVSPTTPLPHTPAYNHILPKETLLNLPTPVSNTPVSTKSSCVNISTTFNLETPIRNRRKRRLPDQQDGTTKKFRSNDLDYLEVGLALPSIYV